MSRNTQQLMLFCTAVVMFVAACMHGQHHVRLLAQAMDQTIQGAEAMEGKLTTTLRISEPERYSGAEVLHTVRQMTGTTIQVEVDGITYRIDPLADTGATVPVQLMGFYRPEFTRDESGKLNKVSFWKEAGDID